MRGRRFFVTAVAVVWLASFVAAFLPGNVYGSDQILTDIVGLPFVAVGLIIGVRRPENRTGLLFSAAGGSLAAYAVFGDYAGLARTYHWPGANVGAALASAIWHPAFLFLVLTFLAFPSGEIRTTPLRMIRNVAVTWYSLGFLAELLWPAGPVHDHFPLQHAPWHLPGAASGLTFYNVFLPTQLLLLVFAVVSLVLRLIRSKGVERQQLKWFVYPVVLAIGSLLISLVIFSRGVLFIFTYPLMPAGAAVAILRYRLYEIDRIVSRTVSYAVILGVLAGMFAAIVLLPTAALSAGRVPSWLVAGATLAAALLFAPVRRRVQRIVDRRFNRVRYDAARTVEAFVARLRDDIDIDALTGEITALVAQTVQPSHVTLWLRP